MPFIQTDPSPEDCLTPSEILDFNHPETIAYYRSTGADSITDPIQKAVKLYYAVRDDIRYDPYSPFFLSEHYRASHVIRQGRGYCVAKAALLCALGRGAGIPARLGFATVKNHLVTKELIETLGSDLFVYHGYVEFYLNGKWVKATPAFNKALCRLHDVPPLDFDGHADSVFQAYNRKQQRFMEYMADHGTFSDVPLDRILEAWRHTYGTERVNQWIQAMASPESVNDRDFYQEEIVK